MSKTLWDTGAGESVLWLGTFTANGATAVVVSSVPVGPNMTIEFGLKTVGGTPAGAPYLSAVTLSTAGSPGPEGSPGYNGSISIKAAADDTSVYNIRIFN